jgi:hypothetical protein
MLAAMTAATEAAAGAVPAAPIAFESREDRLNAVCPPRLKRLIRGGDAVPTEGSQEQLRQALDDEAFDEKLESAAGSAMVDVPCDEGKKEDQVTSAVPLESLPSQVPPTPAVDDAPAAAAAASADVSKPKPSSSSSTTADNLAELDIQVPAASASAPIVATTITTTTTTSKISKTTVTMTVVKNLEGCVNKVVQECKQLYQALDVWNAAGKDVSISIPFRGDRFTLPESFLRRFPVDVKIGVEAKSEDPKIRSRWLLTAPEILGNSLRQVPRAKQISAAAEPLVEKWFAEVEADKTAAAAEAQEKEWAAEIKDDDTETDDSSSETTSKKGKRRKHEGETEGESARAQKRRKVKSDAKAAEPEVPKRRRRFSNDELRGLLMTVRQFAEIPYGVGVLSEVFPEDEDAAAGTSKRHEIVHKHSAAFMVDPKNAPVVKALFRDIKAYSVAMQMPPNPVPVPVPVAAAVAAVPQPADTTSAS